jgi:hypothetical protein
MSGANNFVYTADVKLILYPEREKGRGGGRGERATALFLNFFPFAEHFCEKKVLRNHKRFHGTSANVKGEQPYCRNQLLDTVGKQF